MCDKLTFDLSQEVEGNPSVFVRKDWVNILDNQTSNYTANQSVLDTSQLSNSNKYMSYREAYFLMPLTLTIASLGQGQIINQTTPASVPVANIVDSLSTVMQPSAQAGANAYPDTLDLNNGLDNCIGLKNWFGNLIHSFTLDYNGSTIIQQTPFVNMWNSFKLMTSLSYNDVITQGCTIGFYPDNAETFSANFTASFNDVAPSLTEGVLFTNVYNENNVSVLSGNGVVNNNNNFGLFPHINSYQGYLSGYSNTGLANRIRWISYDDKSPLGLYQDGCSLNSLLSQANCAQLWKSYIVKKQNQSVVVANVPTNTGAFTQTTPGLLQYGIVATIYLKHVHSFFNMVPLLKGVFMKMTMNLNNSACSVIVGSDTLVPDNITANVSPYGFTRSYAICTDATSALGGINPIMLASCGSSSGAQNLAPKAVVFSADNAVNNAQLSISQKYRLSLSVGSRCLDALTTSITGVNTVDELPCKSIYLYIPAYTFNPTFEQAYISSPVKSIKYSDIYQYQVLGVGGQNGGQFNNLLTNGIANVKSVLILPFFSTQGDSAGPVINAGVWDNSLTIAQNTGFIPGVPVWQSPFDPAGTGATSPLCHFTNFNVQVSGANAIYNLQLRAFEQFNNQLYGQNAVNGGLTDGITSSLVDRQQFDLEYCYYYVNVERMLPVEQSVPKSIQILGTSQSSRKVDLMCFIEYGTEVNIDVLTGARV